MHDHLKPTKGLILAAGYGSRLAPLTDQLPKPLFPVLNRPIITYAIERLRAAGIEEVAINVHHLGEEIIDFLGDGSQYGVRIAWFREERILGTGGILRHSRDFWSDSTLVVITSDMLSTLDIPQMIEFHRSHGGSATVGCFLHGWPLEEFGGDVAVLEDGGTKVVEYESKPGAAAKSRHGATGVYIFEPDVVEHMPDSEYFDLNSDFLDEFARTGEFHAFVDVFEFDDFGQGEGYIEGTRLALNGLLGVRPTEPEVAPGIFVHPTARIAASANLVAPVVVGPEATIGEGCEVIGATVIGGGCVLGDGAVVRESVLLPGVQVNPGTTLARALVGDVARTVPAIRRHHLAHHAPTKVR